MEALDQAVAAAVAAITADNASAQFQVPRSVNIDGAKYLSRGARGINRRGAMNCRIHAQGRSTDYGISKISQHDFGTQSANGSAFCGARTRAPNCTACRKQFPREALSKETGRTSLQTEFIYRCRFELIPTSARPRSSLTMERLKHMNACM